MPRSWLSNAARLAAAGVLAWAALLGTTPLARAESGCASETEPNDAPEAAASFEGALCLDGTLPEADQDLLIWNVTNAEAAVPWTFELQGVRGTITAVKVVAITSDPGVTPIVTGSQVLELDAQPGDFGQVAAADILFPVGRYLVGIVRSTLADGSEPTRIDYSLAIAPGEPLPPAGDLEPNDDATSATPVGGAFDLSGDLQGSPDTYAWTIGEAGAATSWDLQALGPLTASVRMTLRDPAGANLASVDASGDGRAALYDLRLPAATYTVTLEPGVDHPTPYSLRAAPGTDALADLEPNDTPAQALPFDPAAGSVRGRLAWANDRDDYRLSVDASLAATQFDLKLIWGPDPAPDDSRQLCLLDSAGSERQCRAGSDGSSLTNLLLPVGEYIVQVRGAPSLRDHYLVRLDRTSPPVTDFETEPNDRAVGASSFGADAAVRGRLAPDEYDYFHTTTTGDPQLWELRATGTKLTALDWVRPDETVIGQGEVGHDGTTALVTDMYLIPGEHWFRVRGTGDYSLRLTALGPPDPNAEREPNGDSLSAEPFPIGATRTGRLPTANDVDVYRFSLSATERVVISIDPPADSGVGFTLQSGSVAFGSDRAPVIDTPVTYDALLEAGDYELWLRPAPASLGTYSLTIDRADPLTLAVDQEPNDTAFAARPLPASLVVDGSGDGDGDPDWFLLPARSTDPASVAVTGSFYSFGLSDGTNDIPLTTDSTTGVATSSPLPSDVPIYLWINAIGDYRAQVLDPSAPPDAPAVALPVNLKIDAVTSAVAAYWPTGQQVDATIDLTNTGIASLDLTLDAITSHYAWTAEPGATSVSIAAGETVSVPLTIRTLPDAWAEVPVRVTARVRTADGAQRTASLDITPGRDVPPVSPQQAWSVPAPLLGGLDVASLALGAVPAGTVDAQLETQLHDGVTPAGSGFAVNGPTMPLTLTVDLAGDDPVPVVGTILNPQASDADLTSPVRSFELLLSLDGSSYAVALSGVLSPLNIDQAFVLDAPVMARYAQLRVLSTRDPATSRVVLGEWKVIAAPGSAPQPGPLNIADPVRGGHIVAMTPNSDDLTFTDNLLSEDPARQTLAAEPRTSAAWTIGFQDDRAAQVTELQWVDPPESDPKARFHRVDLAISLDSPVGPWTDLGTWKLDRAADGTLEPFTLPAPTWARYIRFTTDASAKDVYALEMPATIRVLERPTDPDYRSVLGQWGQSSPVGPYEWLNPPDLAVVDQETVPNDTPETATALQPGEAVSGRAQGEIDVDWYRITIPVGQNSVSFTLSGKPTVGVSVALFDAAGERVLMGFGPGATPGTIVYSANVNAGASYTVRVQQPPFSAVITFDTSGSIGPYLAFVEQAMRAYTSDVTRGQESISIIPFEEDPLLPDWSDEPYLLQDAVDRYVPGAGSSSGEQALLDASARLATREGARAILVVTDAETSSYAAADELWAEMASTRPLIFAVHIGADTDPIQATHFMQDWAGTSNGFYQYARSHAEVDRAFDRMATWLRRPAAYHLAFQTSVERLPPPDPGTLSVATEGGPGTPAPVGSGVAIEIVLDTSGSMLDRFGGQRRIDIAKRVLAAAVRNDLPAGVPVALRVFTQRKDSCQSELAVPLGPLDKERLATLIEGLKVNRSVNTPLAAALREVASDLGAVSGRKIVILVSDGEESCGGDPAKVVRQLRAQGLEITLNVIGLALDDSKIRKSIQQLAILGGGSYFDARSPGQLDTALAGAVSAPFEVRDETGVVVGGGTVNGAPIELPPGTYRVVVLTDPEVTYDAVVIPTRGSVTLTLPDMAAPVPSPAPGASPGSLPEASGNPDPSPAPVP